MLQLLKSFWRVVRTWWLLLAQFSTVEETRAYYCLRAVEETERTAAFRRHTRVILLVRRPFGTETCGSEIRHASSVNGEGRGKKVRMKGIFGHPWSLGGTYYGREHTAPENARRPSGPILALHHAIPSPCPCVLPNTSPFFIKSGRTEPVPWSLPCSRPKGQAKSGQVVRDVQVVNGVGGWGKLTQANRNRINLTYGEYEAAAECMGGGNKDIPEKILRPAASPSTMPTCENLGATSPRIEPSSPRWEAIFHWEFNPVHFDGKRKMALSVLPNNPMNFTENQHGNAVLEKLKIQKEQGRFCDVTLYVEGKQFKAHRSVLASCSPYFDSVLKMHRTVKERLTIICQNSEIFSCLLNYMYTGSVVIDKNNVAELLRLSNHFLVNKLKSYCAEYLDRYLDVTNCLSVREMAEKYNMPALSKAATVFVQVHVNKVTQQDELLNNSFTKIESFLSEKSWSIPPNAVLSLIARWISRDIGSRERNMRALLTFVDWNGLDGVLISEHVDREPLYSNSEACLYFILQALVDNNLLFPKYQGIYQALQDKFIQAGFSLHNDTYLSMGVSSMMDSIGEHPSVHSAQVEHLDNGQVGDKSACSRGMVANSEDGKVSKQSPQAAPVSIRTTKKIKRKLILRRFHRRKEKLYRLHPGARLAALSRHNKRSKQRSSSALKNSDDDEPVSGYSCHLCPHVAPDTTRLEQHLAEVHSIDVTYKCGVCGFICQWNKDYLAHMKGHFPGPPFKCDTCDFCCDRIQQVLTHRMKHSDERPHRCDQCGYSCRTRSSLLAHLRCHSADRPFKCEICGRAFSARTTLEQHLASHSNDRPYTCDICGFSTKYLSHLIAHKRIHAGDVYRCSYPQCKYSTPKKSQLGSHARTHGVVRPHSCNICGRGFLEKSHLVRHERIHLEEKPFKCSQCEYASSRRDKLKEHFGRHHGENASAKVPYKARPMRSTGSSSSSSSSGHMSLMMQHHPPQASYPPFSEAPPHPSPLDYPPPYSRQAAQPGGPHPLVRSSQQAVAAAAMMLDPRFHHPNPSYHPSMGAQGQGMASQHHQPDYPCMPPLF
ncbi:hypothetical protein PR048_029612 [Dryococelus australis]|uniref:Uncharacterized protein n=1 Tax=Dryococelus australis TaxID=614101 RepID=A0ABQ9GDV8_9NEOP|nr:hypothetical protein PR048_029612 [Dryococelus australis]